MTTLFVFATKVCFDGSAKNDLCVISLALSLCKIQKIVAFNRKLVQIQAELVFCLVSPFKLITFIIDPLQLPQANFFSICGSFYLAKNNFCQKTHLIKLSKNTNYETSKWVVLRNHCRKLNKDHNGLMERGLNSSKKINVRKWIKMDYPFHPLISSKQLSDRSYERFTSLQLQVCE